MVPNAQLPDNLTDLYRPILLTAVRAAGPRTRALLRPAMKIALAAVEVLCPPGLVKTSTGTNVVRGPSGDTARQLLPVMAATARASFVFSFTEWPDPAELVVPPNLSAKEHRIAVWNQIAHGVEEQNAEMIAHGTAALIVTRGDVDQLRDSVASARAAGTTPLLVVLCARRVRGDIIGAGGAVCLLPLPPALEAQNAEAERATQTHEVLH
jgi:hypothetical protein